MSASDGERDFETYKQILGLWISENPIKTNKLQVLLVVNGLLLTGVQINGGFVPANWPLYLGGAVCSLIWLLSIGRTSLYQKVWRNKLGELARKYGDDPRFQTLHVGTQELRRVNLFLRISGGVSSKYYLIGVPFAFTVTWTVLLLYQFPL